MDKRRFIEEASGEEFTHRAVWLVVRRQLEHAEANPEGAQLDHLVAMVFVSHALEGYANFLGEKIAPDLWKNERKTFAKTGVAGKLLALHERCGLEPPEQDCRPWSTLRELKRLRDRIAHPRTITTSETTEYAEGEEPPLFARSWVSGLVSHEKALCAVEDAKAIVDRLHEAALVSFPRSRLLPGALDGILAMRTTSAKLKE